MYNTLYQWVAKRTPYLDQHYVLHYTIRFQCCLNKTLLSYKIEHFLFSMRITIVNTVPIAQNVKISRAAEDSGFWLERKQVMRLKRKSKAGEEGGSCHWIAHCERKKASGKLCWLHNCSWQHHCPVSTTQRLHWILNRELILSRKGLFAYIGIWVSRQAFINWEQQLQVQFSHNYSKHNCTYHL